MIMASRCTPRNSGLAGAVETRRKKHALQALGPFLPLLLLVPFLLVDLGRHRRRCRSGDDVVPAAFIVACR